MPPSLRSAVELRLGEKSRRLAQDLVGAFQLQVLAFELLEAFSFRTRQPGAFALVTFGLPYPFTQGLPCAADLTRNRDDRRPLRLVLPLMLEHHPNSPFTELRRIFCCCFHDSILSRIGVSGKPGAVQLLAHADLVFAQEREATADQARLAELEQMVGRLTMELEAAKKASQLLSLPSKRNGR